MKRLRSVYLRTFNRLLFALILSVTLPVSAFDIADAPNAVPNDAVSRHDALRELYKFNRRSLVDAYQEHGTHDPSWDRDALELLDLYAVLFTYGKHESSIYTDAPMEQARKDFRSPEHLIALLEKADCQDPMVRYLIGFYYSYTLGDNAKALPILLKSQEAFEGSNYPKIRQFYCLRRCLQQTRFERITADVKQMRKAWRMDVYSVAIDSLNEAASEGSQFVRDLYVEGVCDLIETVSREFNQADRINYLVGFLESLEEIKHSSPWCYHAARGMISIKVAWAYRGGGFANTVKEFQWQGFERYLTQANDSFASAWDISPSVLVACEMITVAMGGHSNPGEDCRFWFERSKALLFDNPASWEAMSYAMLPKWGGSHESMLQLAIEAVDTGRYDTGCPEQFIRIMEQIDKDRGDRAAWTRPNVVDAIERLTRGLADERDAANENWFTLLRAAYMWRANSYEKTVAAFEEAGPLEGATLKTARQVFQSHSEDLSMACQASYAFTSPIKRHIGEAFEMIRSGEAEKALVAIKLLHRDSQELHPHVQTFLQYQISLIEFYTTFYSGEWVEIDHPDSLGVVWEQVHGEWAFDEEGRLVGQSDENGMSLVFRHGLRKTWEIAFDFEILESPPKPLLNLGLTYPYFDQSERGVWFYPATADIYRSAVIGNRTSEMLVSLEPGVNRVNLVHNLRGELSSSINGAKAYQRPIYLGKPDDNSRFALSSRPHTATGVDSNAISKLKVRYSNIRVRLIQEQ